MKKFLTPVTLFILCFVFSLNVHAFTFPGYGSPSGSSSIIISEINNDIEKEIIILEETESLELSHFSMGSIYPYFDSNAHGQLLEIEWNLKDTSLLEPGLHEVTGTPILKEGVSLAEGFDPTCSWPVFRKGNDAKLEIQSLSISSTSNKLLALGGNPETDLNYSSAINYCSVGESWQIDTKKDNSFYCDWDFSKIDVNTQGAYEITGTIHYPEWILCPEKYQTFSSTVYVMPTDRIEIFSPLTVSLNGLMDIHWLYNCKNVMNPVLEIQTDEGIWEPCDESWYKYYNSYNKETAYLSLHLLKITPDISHVLRLRYQDIIDGETIERITEPVIFTVPSNIAELLTQSAVDIEIDLFEGDRDGSDNIEPNLPDYEQPAPEVENKTEAGNESKIENSSETPMDYSSNLASDTLYETVTDTYTAISGLRLNQLVKSGTTVLFEKQGVSVEIPSELLKSLNIGNNDLFEITILLKERNIIQISVAANGSPVEDLIGTLVSLPWDSSNGTEILCLDSSGHIVSNASYNEETGILQFEISSPGTYLLSSASNTVAETNTIISDQQQKDTPVSETTTASVMPLLFLIFVITLLIIMILIVKRRWKHE